MSFFFNYQTFLNEVMLIQKGNHKIIYTLIKPIICINRNVFLRKEEKRE